MLPFPAEGWPQKCRDPDIYIVLDWGKDLDYVDEEAKDYIFDLEKFMSFEGKTGPYLLYTIVRLKSILNKAEEKGYKTSEIGCPETDVERDLMLKLLTMNELGF